MRIELNFGAQQTSETSHTDRAAVANSGPAMASQGLTEDQADVSNTHLHLKALVGQAAQLPEIRQERVQALRLAIDGGTYRPSLGEVAGAMLAEIAGKPAALKTTG